ncbi:MAG: sulfatase-like hydrolase/transferase [Desulfovibrionaceae bacterium]|nr:sulfatase-like hydrolase/transferase [Desulfovibrionaceae bacterium]
MSTVLIPISSFPAAAVTAASLFLVFLLTRRNPVFPVITAILMLIRLISAHDLFLVFHAQAWLAAALGALKDLLPLTPFLLLMRFRLCRILGALTGTAVVLLNIIDLVYIKETFSRLQHEFFENTDLTSIFIRFDFFVIGLGGIILTLLLLLPLFLKAGNNQGAPGKILLTGVCTALFLLNPAPQIPKTGEYLTDEINMERDFALVIVAASAVKNFLWEGVWPAPAESRPLYEYSPEESLLLEQWGVLDPRQANSNAGNLQNAAPVPDGSASPYRRIIYVFIESLSYDFLQCKLTRPDACTMPFYFSLLNNPENIYLSNYYSSAFTTDEGIYAAFASRPNFGGDDAAGRRPENIFSLARRAGYKSAYFLGASVYFRSKFKTYVNTMQVDEVYGLEQDMGLPPLQHSFQWGDTDERIFEKALLWQKEHRAEKSISIICTINTHPPFFSKDGPPPGVEDTPITRAFYSTDIALKNFVQGLEENGLLDDRTLLIIGADHQITHGGEEAREHLPEKKFGNRHIPLVFVSKNRAPLQGIYKDAHASAVDIAPTLGDLLGLPEQPGYYGKSLFLPERRYDLAVTRGGLFFFGTEEMNMSFDLRYEPQGTAQSAIYKWYFNQQQADR